MPRATGAAPHHGRIDGILRTVLLCLIVGDLIAYVFKEWRTISGAPFIFSCAVLLVGGAIWWALDWRYGGIVETLKARLDHRDEDLARLRAETFVGRSSAATIALVESAQASPPFPLTATAPLVVPVKEPSDHTPPKDLVRAAVPLTAVQLVKLCRDRTELQAQPMLEVYVGNWMEVSGEVFAASRSYNGERTNVSISIPDSENAWTMIFVELSFETAKWGAQLDMLQIGARITACGCLRRADVLGVHLDQCEMAD